MAPGDIPKLASIRVNRKALMIHRMRRDGATGKAPAPHVLRSLPRRYARKANKASVVQRYVDMTSGCVVEWGMSELMIFRELQ